MLGTQKSHSRGSVGSEAGDFDQPRLPGWVRHTLSPECALAAGLGAGGVGLALAFEVVPGRSQLVSAPTVSPAATSAHPALIEIPRRHMLASAVSPARQKVFKGLQETGGVGTFIAPTPLL